eukprot:52029_1
MKTSATIDQLNLIRTLCIGSVSLLICILLIRRVYCIQLSQEFRENRSLKFTCIASMISFSLSYYCEAFEVGMNHILNQNIILVSYFLTWIFFGLAFAFFYSCAVLRLYHSFEGSQFAITSTLIHYFHVFIIIVILISQILGAMFVYNNETNNFYRYVIGITDTLLLFIGGLQLMYVFNNNLFNLILLQRKHPHYYNMRDINDNFGILNSMQILLLQAITKQTLLATIQIVTGMIFIIIIAPLALLNLKPSNPAYIVMTWIIGFAIWIIEICMYLGFPINHRRYELCCYKCDQKWRIMCERCAAKNIRNRTESNHLYYHPPQL